MKVLMFGWEFPPHMSGGLGTACFGLTKALLRQDIEVLFVVPKLHGDECAGRLIFINASTVNLNGTTGGHGESADKKPIPELSESLKESVPKPFAARTSSLGKSKYLTYVEVPSTLLPYQSADLTKRPTSIDLWNYNMAESAPTTQSQGAGISPNPDSVLDGCGKTLEGEQTQRYYRFSGAYGPGLFQEVERYAQVAAEIAKTYAFDLIHAHDWMTYPAGIAAKEVSQKPLLIHVHATEYDRSGENVNTRIRNVELEGMRKADRIITVSSWTKKIVTGKYKINEDKVDVVHNGVTVVNTEKVEFESPIRGAPIVTFVGRITHQKGPLFFVEAALKVMTRIPNAHFIVVGSGDLLPVMIETVAMYRMSSHFHFTGFGKGQDIQKIWSISDVYVMPSVSEPFGITPLEAAQAGVPVIISKQSGVAEVMPHALSVDFWNVDSLAASICSVLSYKSLSDTLKANSRTHAKKLSWDRAARKLKIIYKHVLCAPSISAQSNLTYPTDTKKVKRPLG